MAARRMPAATAVLIFFAPTRAASPQLKTGRGEDIADGRS
jgi:hypothetical protein